MSKKIIYINLDGFSYSYYEEFHRRKMDKNFNFLKNNNMFFKNLENGIISITNPMQSAILCGAWSNKTHNIYQHYDRVNKCVVKEKRTFDAENIAQTMEKIIKQLFLFINLCWKIIHVVIKIIIVAT